ncbi:MAG: hypothetical protein AAFV53_25575 [Myxococcota bacterium]
MRIDWLLEHEAALQILPWTVGIIIAMVRIGRGGVRSQVRSWGAVVLLTAMVALGQLSWFPELVPRWLGPLVDLRGVEVWAQWSVIAMLVMLGVRRHSSDWRSWSLIPLPMLGWLGGGALISSVVIAASGTLERDQPYRWALLGGLGLFALSHGVDLFSLQLWVWVRQGLWLGYDTASFFVDISEQLFRLGGWTLLLAWSMRWGAPRRMAAEQREILEQVHKAEAKRRAARPTQKVGG